MKRPDIIWIYTDEMRADAIGAYGNPWTEIATPNLDRLADMGARFENCFCNSPVCVPSRYSTLTGLHCADTGVYNNEPAWDWVDHGLHDRFTTIPECFAAAGYRTANFGKSHVPNGIMPWQHHDPRGDMKSTLGAGSVLRRMFDCGETPEGLVQLSGPHTMHAGIFPKDGAFPGEAVTENGLAWLEQAESPVFVRFSYLQPHTPVFPPAPFASRYAPEAFADRPDEAQCSRFETWFGEMQHPAGDLPPEEVNRTRAHYYGLATWLDDQVGRILDWLDRRRRLDNTVLVFASDHGVSLGEGKRFGKQTFAPETHHVPLLIVAPGRIPAGLKRNDLCENLDLGRTLFALGGIAAPAQFRGRDLFRDPAPEAVYSCIGFGEPDSLAFPLGRFGRWRDGAGWPRRACVRTREYRLDMNVRQDGKAVAGAARDVFLADVLADPHERKNRADDPALADLRDGLIERLDAHLAAAVEGVYKPATGRA